MGNELWRFTRGINKDRVINCSFDELTVIHSFTSGNFASTVHEHLPKYFMRFGVILDSDYRRVYEMSLDTD